jgi:hypothetical protein
MAHKSIEDHHKTVHLNKEKVGHHERLFNGFAFVKVG